MADVVGGVVVVFGAAVPAYITVITVWSHCSNLLATGILISLGRDLPRAAFLFTAGVALATLGAEAITTASVAGWWGAHWDETPRGNGTAVYGHNITGCSFVIKFVHDKLDGYPRFGQARIGFWIGICNVGKEGRQLDVCRVPELEVCVDDTLGRLVVLEHCRYVCIQFPKALRCNFTGVYPCSVGIPDGVLRVTL